MIKEEDFTLKLAIVDTIPVLFFLGSMIVLSKIFPSTIFLFGATFSLIAGFSKVIWKLLMGLKLGNHQWISYLFIPFQCAGFPLMIASLVIDRKFIHVSAMLETITSFPCVLFFGIGIVGMIGMIVLASHFDQSVRSHWKAECINTIAQGAFFIGLLLCR